MLKLKLVYNTDSKQLLDSLNKSLQNIEIESYLDSYYKDKRKAIQIKASCGTKLSPFAALYNDGVLIKAFYSEDNSCVADNIINFINK